MCERRFIRVGLVLAGLLIAAPAPAPAAEPSRAAGCDLVGFRALIREVRDKAQCYERSLRANTPVSNACLTRAERNRRRLSKRFEGSTACKTLTYDEAGLGMRIDGFLRDMLRAVEELNASSAPPKSAPATGAGASAQAATPSATATPPPTLPAATAKKGAK